MLTQNIAPILALVYASLVVSVQGVSDTSQELDRSNGYAKTPYAPPPPYSSAYSSDNPKSNQGPARPSEYKQPAYASTRAYAQSSPPERTEDSYPAPPPYRQDDPYDTDPSEYKKTLSGPTSRYNDQPDIPRSNRGDSDGRPEYTKTPYEPTPAYGRKSAPERAEEFRRESNRNGAEPQLEKNYGRKSYGGEENYNPKYPKGDRVWNQNEYEREKLGAGYDEDFENYYGDADAYREPEWRQEYKAKAPGYMGYDKREPVKRGNGWRNSRGDYLERNGPPRDYRDEQDDGRRPRFADERSWGRGDYQRDAGWRSSRPVNPSRQSPPRQGRYDDEDQYFSSKNNRAAKGTWQDNHPYDDDDDEGGRGNYYDQQDRMRDDYSRRVAQESHRKNSVSVPERGDHIGAYIAPREQFSVDPNLEHKYSQPTVVNTQIIQIPGNSDASGKSGKSDKSDKSDKSGKSGKWKFNLLPAIKTTVGSFKVNKNTINLNVNPMPDGGESKKAKS